jgi:acetylornithine deacetylase
MPGQDYDQLINRAGLAAKRCGLDFIVECRGAPLCGDPTSEFLRETVRLAGHDQARTISYGSDGVYFTELKQILVLGPGSVQQAHRTDEWISLEQLNAGSELYEQILRRWCVH